MHHPRIRERSHRARRRGDDRGAALVEFALVAPVLFLVLFGIIEFGIGLNDYQSIRQGVREGTRQAVVKQFEGMGTACTSVIAPDEVKRVICLTEARIGLGSDVRVRVQYFEPEDLDNDGEADADGDHGSVLVCAQRNVNSITGAIPAIDGITLKSSIQMRMEKPISSAVYTAMGTNDSVAFEEPAPSGSNWTWC